jgi:hypothetical protein
LTAAVTVKVMPRARFDTSREAAAAAADKARAAEQQERAERLAERLRELGIEP